MTSAIQPPTFGTRTITSIKFFDYVRWVNASTDLAYEEPLGLPPVQRTALWTPRHILGLWDSLLHGMPIGTFYLLPSEGVRRSLFDEALPAGSTQSRRVGGYDLLDGQQRTRAMMLALRSPKAEGRCLWIDLAPRLQSRDRTIVLRLTTKSQPFGYDADGGKLSLGDRRAAREAFDGPIEGPAELKIYEDTSDRRAHDHELFDLQIRKSGRPPAPAKASGAATPLHELILLWEESKGVESGFKNSVCEKVAPEFDVRAALDNLVVAFRLLDNAEVAMLLVKQPTIDAAAAPDADWLLRLFERIGAGGVPLSNAERLYSIYKYHEPFIHDTVAAIERDPAVKRAMPPTDIVGTALRIASAEKPGDPAFNIPDTKVFAKEMASEVSSLRAELHKLIPLSAETATYEGLLKNALHLLFDIIVYDKEKNPQGIPRVMLVELSPELIQVMAYWVVLAKVAGTDLSDAHISSDAIRGEMIRLTLFWHLCCDRSEKAGRHLFRFLKGHDARLPFNMAAGTEFPGRKFYAILTGEMDHEPCAYRLMPPDTIAKFAKASFDKQWCSQQARFEKNEVDELGELAVPTRDLYKTWWFSGGKLLLWLQRAYLSKVFSAFDPSSARDEEKPYDLDHIQPKAAWNFSWKQRNARVQDQSLHESFGDGRFDLGDSIGNLRWIGSTENRGDGAEEVKEKLKLHRFAGETAVADPDPWMGSAFDIRPEAIETWIKASGEEDWTMERMQAFQYAVEKRTLWLYEQFWDTAGFAAWF